MKIDSPSDLRKFALTLALKMKSEGYTKQSKILSHRATLPCTTGWEWLGELGLGIEKIRNIGELPIEIDEKLEIINKISKSSTPYG